MTVSYVYIPALQSGLLKMGLKFSLEYQNLHCQVQNYLNLATIALQLQASNSNHVLCL